jgi:DNA-binding transcriptional LysR family regulator
MDWDDLRYFLALARSATVRGAGAQLGVSHATISRRVEALEARLGARLFERTADGFVLTDAGERAFTTATGVEAGVAALERGVLGADERLAGPVRVTAWDAPICELVMPALVELIHQHPGIELEIGAEPRFVNLDLREADIALRVLSTGASPPEHLLGRRLTPMATASYVGRDHVDRLDPERGGSGGRWLAYEDRAFTASIVAASSYPHLPLWGGFRDLVVAAAAARAGAGIVMLPCYVGDHDPGLVRLTLADLRTPAEVWLLSHPDLRATARLQAVRACLRDAIAGISDLLRGDRPRAAVQI